LSPATSGAAANVTQTFDQDDRLMAQNGSSVTTDPDGNLLSIASGVTPATYTYDARNRLTAAGGLTYGYNSENRRVSVTDSTGTTQFAINPNAALDQVLIKTASNGTQTYYVYGLGLLYEDSGGAARFYHFDRRGDTVVLTDITGSVSSTIAYGAYGEILDQTGQTNTPFLFNGLWGVQTDSNGLYFHRARYYHPALRRWLNADPIGLAGGLNLYAYVGNNPIANIDPRGTDFSMWIGGGTAYGNFTGSQIQGPGPQPLPRQVSQAIGGSGMILGSIPVGAAGIALSRTGAGATLGIPITLYAVLQFDLGLVKISNAFAGGNPVNTPNGSVPGSPIGLVGAMTGNPNVQTFGDMVGTLMPPYTADFGTMLNLAGIVVEPPEFDPNSWPFAYPNSPTSPFIPNPQAFNVNTSLVPSRCP
jgi:RHS repeat-associated protein